jgi:ATP-dependent DNA helicase RecQ
MSKKKSDAHPFNKIARTILGTDKLRPGQQDAIQAVLSGHDTLVIMPTGSGKSFIYQAAGSLLPGLTIVISPLIALQQDQVMAINAIDIGQAAVINSTQRQTETQDILARLQSGKIKFLFLAPEQFHNEELLQYLRLATPSLFVIDEAHCISEWGHDFRPDYLRLGTIIDALDHPRVLALTATASPPVRKEIVERLHLQQPHIMVSGFDRPNIWLGIEYFQDDQDKQRALIERVLQEQLPGIVYVSTRKHAEEVAQALQQIDIKAAFYHAGMKAQEREEIQSAFMNNTIQVIVATIAFGMGVDKPDVRFVFHFDISDAIDAYYQEFGRAGRDGERADAILFYNPKNLHLQQFLSSSGHIEGDEVEAVATVIRAQQAPIDPELLIEKLHLSQTKLMQTLNDLAKLDVVEILPNGMVTPTRNTLDLEEIAEQITTIQHARHEFEHSRVEMMRGYAESQSCRRAYLLNYFGEPFSAPCGFCDICDTGIVPETAQITDEPFPLDSKVSHSTWGEGVVLRYEGDKIIVLFDTVGYKSLSLSVVKEKHLLQPGNAAQ